MNTKDLRIIKARDVNKNVEFLVYHKATLHCLTLEMIHNPRIVAVVAKDDILGECIAIVDDFRYFKPDTTIIECAECDYGGSCEILEKLI